MTAAESVMRVTHIAEATLGGVFRHVCYIARELVARGVSVELILSPRRADPDFPERLRELREAGVDLQIVPMARRPAPIADFTACRQIEATLRSSRPHIVHTHATKAGIVGRWAAAGVRTIAKVHSPHAFGFEQFSDPVRRPLAIAVERRLAGMTDRYVLVSEAEKAAACAMCGLPEEKLTVAINGLPGSALDTVLPRDEVRARLSIGPDELALLFVGRLVPQKGCDVLLRAIARIGLRDRGGRLYMMGTGPDEGKLRRMADDLGVAEAVTWLGFVADAGQLVRGFDLAVMPSRYEAMPYVLLEVVGAGVPLVASEIPAHFPHPQMRRYVRAFTSGDSMALGNTLLAAIDDVAKQPGAQNEDAVAFVRDAFGLDAQVDKLLSVYRDVLLGTDQG